MPTYAAKASDGAGIALTNQYGSYAEAKNNRGIMKSNGTSSSLVGSVRTARPVVATFASTPISSGITVSDYATTANASGTFLHDHIKPITALVTTELAGLTNRSLLSPGNDQSSIRSINKQETITTRKATTSIRAGNFNIYTGKFSPAPLVTVDSWGAVTGGNGANTSLNTTSTDTAASPTRTSPGKITYMRGSLLPYRDNYKSKTN